MWTNAGILSIGPLRTHFIEILIEIYIQDNAFEKTSGNWRVFWLGLNVLRWWRAINWHPDCDPDDQVTISWRSGSRLNIKTVFSRPRGIRMLKIIRQRDRLIFNMGIPLLVKRHLYIEMAPGWGRHGSQRISVQESQPTSTLAIIEIQLERSVSDQFQLARWET